MIEALDIPQNINTHLTIDDFDIIGNIGKNRWGNICKIIINNTNQIYLSNIIDKNIIDNHDTLIQQIQNKEISPIQNIISECKFISKFQELTKDKFNMVKAFDGCKVDLIYKPEPS